MARFRLLAKRAMYKQGEAKHLGWSKGKTSAIVTIMTIFIVFILAVFVALFLIRLVGNAKKHVR